jgi:hypothetical protein
MRFYLASMNGRRKRTPTRSPLFAMLYLLEIAPGKAAVFLHYPCSLK